MYAVEIQLAWDTDMPKSWIIFGNARLTIVPSSLPKNEAIMRVISISHWADSNFFRGKGGVCSIKS